MTHFARAVARVHEALCAYMSSKSEFDPLTASVLENCFREYKVAAH